MPSQPIWLTLMPSKMLLIAAPAGIGKTTIGVRTAEDAAAASQRVLYVGPRREFFADVQSWPRPAWWTAWRHATAARARPALVLPAAGPIRSVPDDARLCRENLLAVIRASVAGTTGTPPVATTPRSARPGRLLFAQYEHIALGHPLMEQMALIIGDELPIRAFLHPWQIPASAIVPPDIADPRPPRFRRLYTLATVPNIT